MNDQERLEVIKDMHENDEAVHQFDIEWLIQQAERVEFLEKAHRINIRIAEYAKEERNRYKQALEFYADEGNYVLWNSMSVSKKNIELDKGSKARRELKVSDEDE